jgi:hypothetical protein
MNGVHNKTIARTRGTAQRDRFLRALMPENIQVDARELHSFLSFCARSARLIRNVNAQNEPEGTWADALEKDPAVFLAMLMDNKPETWDNEIREILRRFYAASGAGKSNECAALIDKMLELAALLDGWYKNSIRLLKWGGASPVTPVLEKAIEAELGPGLQRLRRMISILTAAEQLKDDEGWNNQFATFDSIWWRESTPPGDEEKTVADSATGNETAPTQADEDDDPLKTAVEEMRIMLHRLQFSMTYINLRAPMWFQEALDKKSDHDPYVGLLLTFLQLFLHARDQMNTLPQKHLHHYYFDLLHQKMKPPVPDRTVVSFQLTESTRQFLLPKGTKLLAGVNKDGLESHYATMEDVMLSGAQIASLRTTFVSRSDMMKADSSYKLVSSVYAASVANSRDGIGAPFNLGNTSWPAFGEEQLDKNPAERQMSDAQLGFIIAAPILLLREGDREIDLQFQFTHDSLVVLIDLIDDIAKNKKQAHGEVVPRLFSKGLLLYASGEAGWFPIDKWTIDLPDQWMETGLLTLRLFLSSETPALLDNNPEVIGESFDTPWPLLKIVLNPDHETFLYSFVAALELEALNIKTRVKGLKSLTLMNDIGLLDNSAPFMPFGAVPNRNAYMLIGSVELFRKRLSDLKIHIEWNNLPDTEGGFAEYYREYNPSINNDSFQVQLSALSNFSFRPQDAQQRETFPLFSGEHPTGKLLPTTTIENIKLNYFQIKPDYQTALLPEYSNNLRSGYFKLQLCKLPMAFGHADYPRLFTKAMIDQTRATPGLFGLGGEQMPVMALPREPYVPVIEKISVDYAASSSLVLSTQSNEEKDPLAKEKIISLYPFGKRVIFNSGIASDTYLFSRFGSDGYLYIGLNGVQPGQPVHLLFSIQESKNAVQDDSLKVTWSFLRDNVWNLFSEDARLSDKTHQLTTTGIISLIIPYEIDIDNTVMPTGLFWVRAAARGNLDIIGRILEVQINAVEVVWVDNGDIDHYNTAVPLAPIQDLVQAKPEIVALKQVLGYYGARPLDKLSSFYVRTSERLRHKNRAISTWDVERMVLENFPNIRLAKCIGWMEHNKLLPGQMKVVVIPQTPATIYEPKIGYDQLDQISQFIRNKTTAFADIKVINPVYEKIKITCMIVLNKGLENEKGKYLQLLHEELRHFICPWLQGVNFVLGGDISKNDVLVFIKDRPYVQFVTRFSMVQLFEGKDDEVMFIDTASKASTSEILLASTPWSILTPVDQHNIQFIVSDDNVSPVITGIEDMRLGTDFLVSGGPEKGSQAPGVKMHETPESADDESAWYLSLK